MDLNKLFRKLTVVLIEYLWADDEWSFQTSKNRGPEVVKQAKSESLRLYLIFEQVAKEMQEALKVQIFPTVARIPELPDGWRYSWAYGRPPDLAREFVKDVAKILTEREAVPTG